MSEVIVDTNVAIIANRQNSSVVANCVEACIRFLAEAPTKHIVLIDEGDEIRAEYAKALEMSRPYELGAQFLIHVLRQQFNPARVRRVALPKAVSGEFSDFPTDPMLATFDVSDRKFAALARKTGVAVTNATDSDWADYLAALNANGISVKFLCGCDKTKWFTA